MKIRDIQRGCSILDEEFINSMRQAEKKNDFHDKLYKKNKKSKMK